MVYKDDYDTLNICYTINIVINYYSLVNFKYLRGFFFFKDERGFGLSALSRFSVQNIIIIIIIIIATDPMLLTKH